MEGDEDELLEGVDEALEAEGLLPSGSDEAEPASAETEEPPTEGTEPTAEGAPPAEEAPDPVAEEVAELKLSERSAKRFRELHEHEKALAPIREAAEKAGVDLANIGDVFARAQERDELVEMVSSTGATPEMFGRSLDYMRDVSAARSGDVQAAQRAWDALLPEVQALAAMLGKEMTGVADPLAAHEDLLAAVDSGDIDRKLALELAAARGQGQVRQQHDAQQQQARESDQAVQWLRQYDATMMQLDASYAAKRPMLDAMVANIRQTLPPAQWPQAVQLAYASIPSIPAPAPARPKPGPVRPHSPPADMGVGTYDSFEDAIEAGLRSIG